jgi:sugar lactone lactonase YvrE
MRSLGSTVLAALLALSAVSARTLPGSIVIDDRNVFPESLSSTPDGTLYIGSNLGRIYRAKTGDAYAEPWLLPEATGLHEGLRGILADKASNTLWVCDNNGKESSLVRFALTSGKKRAVYDFPGGGHCNDISLRGGSAYVTDTSNGRILKLATGAPTLGEWYKQADRSLDGLVWTQGGKLYTNTYSTHHLIRVDVNADGSAGKGTVLQTSEPLYQPDGMRLTPDGRVLLAEGRGQPGAPLKEGRVDEVTFAGDSASIKVLKSGFEPAHGRHGLGAHRLDIGIQVRLFAQSFRQGPGPRQVPSLCGADPAAEVRESPVL